MIQEEEAKPIVPEYVSHMLARKVYLLVSLQWCVTTLSCFVASRYPSSFLFSSEVGTVATVCILPLSVATSCLGSLFPWNVILLLLLTLSTSASLSHLSSHNPSVPLASGVCSLLFLVLSCAGWKRDFSFLAPYLLAGSVALLLYLLLFHVTSSLYGWAGTVLFSGYVLYVTSLLAKEYGPDDAIEACLHLYLDVINLLLSLLSLGEES